MKTHSDLILGHTQPEPPPGCQAPCCLPVNAMGAPAPRDPELRLPPFLVHLVYLVCLVSLVYLVSLVQPKKRDKPNKPDEPDRPASEIASSRGKVEIMPQDMVVQSLSDIDLSTAQNDPRPSASQSTATYSQGLSVNTSPGFLGLWPTNGNAGQAPSPYNPKYLLLKMPYRFNTSYQLLVRSSECLLYDWFLSLDLRRSRP